MILSEAATLAKIEPFWSWNTPICWTGFILFADAIVYRARGNSWIRSNPREFAVLALASIPLWLVFEFFNLYPKLALRRPARELVAPDVRLRLVVCDDLAGDLRGRGADRGDPRVAGQAGARGTAGVACAPTYRVHPAPPARPARYPPCASPPAPSCWPLRFSSRRPSPATWRRRCGSGSSFCSIRSTPVSASSGSLREPDHQPGVERPAVRCALGVLELLVASQVALHGADHGGPEDLRDAGAGLSRIPGVRLRVLHDVRVRARARLARLRRSDGIRHAMRAIAL